MSDAFVNIVKVGDFRFYLKTKDELFFLPEDTLLFAHDAEINVYKNTSLDNHKNMLLKDLRKGSYDYKKEHCSLRQCASAVIVSSGIHNSREPSILFREVEERIINGDMPKYIDYSVVRLQNSIEGDDQCD